MDLNDVHCVKVTKIGSGVLIENVATDFLVQVKKLSQFYFVFIFLSCKLVCVCAGVIKER